MNKIQNIIKKLYWLGLIGIIGTVFHIKYLKLFYLFFLLAFVNIAISIYTMKKDNQVLHDLKLLWQNICILIGNVFIWVRHGFRIPDVHQHTKIKYHLPFDGEWVVANGGIDRENSHSWNIFSQRYAYDFYIIQDGKTHKENGMNVYDYYCYDKVVLAPAKGIVVKILDIFDDTQVTGKAEIQCDASDVRGNYILIQHASKEFSLIAHLKKGSFYVKEGDHVSCGQAIAHCGNSGNSSEPHIHFQVQEGKSFTKSCSLPICFENVLTDIDNKRSIEYISNKQIVKNK